MFIRGLEALEGFELDEAVAHGAFGVDGDGVEGAGADGRVVDGVFEDEIRAEGFVVDDVEGFGWVVFVGNEGLEFAPGEVNVVCAVCSS